MKLFKICFFGLILTLLVPSLSRLSAQPNPGLADTPWPKFHHDNKNSGLSFAVGPDQPAVKWSFNTDGSLATAPVIGADGAIYQGGGDGNFYAINPDGSLRWTFVIGDIIRISAAIASDGTIYVSSDNDTLYALTPNGTLRWSLAIGADMQSSPAIAPDGTIYLGAIDGLIYAVNPNGTIKWIFQTGAFIGRSSPAIADDGTIYIGSGDKSFYALNPDGSLKWSLFGRILDEGISSSPAIGADGTVYIGANDSLHAVTPEGTILWSFPTNDGIFSAAAIAADGTIHFGSTDNTLYTLDPNGKLLWSFTTNGVIEASPIVDENGTVYVGTSSFTAKLYAINPDGSLKWDLDIGSHIIRSPIMGEDGTIYFGTLGGDILAITSGVAQPADSLIAAYSFSGNANDESGNGNDGTLLGGATVNGTLLIGDNAEDALSIPHTTIDGLTDFTFSARLKINTLHPAGGLTGHAWLHGARSGNTNSFGFFYSPGSNEWEIFGDTGNIFFNDQTIEDGQFHEVMVVRRGALVRLFVDGNEVESAKAFGADPIAVDPNGVIIGQEEDSVGGGFSQSQSWAGEIDDFKIFNRALSPEPTGEIAVQPPGDQTIDNSADITVTPPAGFQPTANQLFFRRGGESTYQVIDLTPSGGDFNGTIPANFVTIRGVEYYVSLSDGASTVTFPGVDPINNPAILPVSVPQLDFQSTLTAQTHRMVSVPLDLASTDIESVLMDDYGEYDVLPRQWRVFRFENGGYEEFPDIAAEFTPGSAFWLITRSGDPFDIENGVSLNTSQPVSIVLPPNDWSQIANPFAFNIDWNTVGNNDLVQLPMLFDGTGYIPQTVLQPFEGYFVFNPNGIAVTLTFDATETQQAPSAQTGNEAVFGLKLSAAVIGTKFTDSHNTIAFQKEASENIDALDLHKPPPISDEIQLNIVQNDHRFARNVKPVNPEGQSWNFEVVSSLPDATVKVELAKLGDTPSGFETHIFDSDNRERVKIEDNMFTIEINPAQVRHFRIMIGTSELAEAIEDDLALPDEFSLEQNYPNPFNPETTIRYTLDKAGDVELAIFNLLGQKIRQLVAENQTPGSYNRVWDGRDENGLEVSSGVYVYRLSTSENVATRKLILIR